MLRMRLAFLAIATFGAACSIGAKAGTSPASGAATWVTLGTKGGPEIRVERSQPANALVVGDSVYLFDVGSGVNRQMVKAQLPLEKVRAIFVSHHHVDHNADVGQLIASRWIFNLFKPIPVIGPPGMQDMVASLVAADRMVEAAPLGGGPRGKPPIASTVAATDLPLTADQPVEIYRDENIRVLAITNGHFHFPPDDPKTRMTRSYSFRIEAPGRTIVYTGDTGPSENVVRLADKADLLVSEVIDLEREKAILSKLPNIPAAALPSVFKHMEEEHLTPTEVATLAAKAHVRRVVLTHLAPGDDGERDLSGYTRGMSSIYKGPVTLAKDLDRF